MSNIFKIEKRKMPSNVRNFIKRSGYVRGYFPELASHASEWIPGAVKSTGSFAWNNMGRLALLASLAAGGYALYNKYKKNKKEQADDDADNYSEVPDSVKSDKNPDSKWKTWWTSDDDEDTDESDVPLPVLADYYGYKRTGTDGNVAKTIDIANQTPGSTIILKTSSYILRNSNKRVNKVKDFLHK